MGFLMPKAPAMPQMVMPEVKDVPNYEDEERKLTEAKELKEATRKRKGRRSTILTGADGLNAPTDAELTKKTLLGG
tara:strand:- start:451 stop:678 length:228 start_codon:yes stop_codon:yes gene_type:complete